LGGSFFLTYNGIQVTDGSAFLGSAPSSSVTMVVNPQPIPEPAAAILTITGALAIALQKLARQLRKSSLTDSEPQSDS
jgi:hypothetical protein